MLIRCMVLLLVHLATLLRRPLIMVCRLLKCSDILCVMMVVMDDVLTLVKLVRVMMVMVTGVGGRSCGGRGRGEVRVVLHHLLLERVLSVDLFQSTLPMTNWCSSVWVDAREIENCNAAGSQSTS